MAAQRFLVPLVRVRILGAERPVYESEGSRLVRGTFSVVVLAAGRGTRMKSSLPKVLHPLCGRTLLGHALATAEALEPLHIVPVVRFERDLVAAEISRVCPQALVADQDEIPGTGRAVFCALEAADRAGLDLGDTVLVTSGDVPLLEPDTLRDLVSRHQQSGAAVTLVTTIAPDPTGYGRVIRTEDGERVARIVEQKDASAEERAVQEINAGIYAFDSAFLRGVLGRIDQNNTQGEVYLTDAAALASSEGRLAVPFVLDDVWQAEGCNDLEQLAALRRVLTERTIRRHLLAGVSIVDPASTDIDVQVTLEPDAVIRPFTQLQGQTHVESGAVVGPFTTVWDSHLESGVGAPHCAIRNARIGAGEQLTPFTSVVGDTKIYGASEI